MAGRLIGRDDLAVCNCAGCGEVLLGERMASMFLQGLYRALVRIPPPVAKRMDDRPFCARCVKIFSPRVMVA